MRLNVTMSVKYSNFLEQRKQLMHGNYDDGNKNGDLAHLFDEGRIRVPAFTWHLLNIVICSH